MGGEYIGANYNLAKTEADKIDAQIIETLSRDTVSVLKLVRVLAKLTL